MALLGISESGEHATVLPGDKMPAQRPGDPGYHTIAALAAYFLATLAFDPAGSAAAAQSAAIAAAASALSDHEAAANPHPTYLTAAEGAAAFDALGAAAAAQIAAASYTDSSISSLRNGVSASFDTLAELASGKQDASANLSAWSALATSAKQDASANLASWSALAPSAKQDAAANLTTLAALSSITPLTRLAASGETVTASSPLLDLAQTFNNGAVQFIGLNFAFTDTASASNTYLMRFQVGGATRFLLGKGGDVRVSSQLAIASDSNPLTFGSSDDTRLYRDAANILAQRNGTGPQALRVYNTWANAGADYERLGVLWSSNVCLVQTAGAGTGSQRELRLEGSVLSLASAGSSRWQVTSAGNFAAIADNAYDIGASGANRPRSIYVGTHVLASGKVQASQGFQADAAASLYWTGRSNIASSADGLITLCNAALTDFSRLCFGGITNAFAAIARSGTALYCKLADDSAVANFGAASFLAGTSGTEVRYGASGDGVALLRNAAATDFTRLCLGGTTSAFVAIGRSGSALKVLLGDGSGHGRLDCQHLTINDGISAPGATTGRAAIYVDSADGDLKVIFADGTIKTIVVDT